MNSKSMPIEFLKVDFITTQVISTRNKTHVAALRAT